jgi:hypothetical protein
VRITVFWQVTILSLGKNLPMFRRTTAYRCSAVKIDAAISFESSKNVYYTTEHRSSHSSPSESQILKTAKRYRKSINEDFSSLTTRTCGSQPWPQFRHTRTTYKSIEFTLPLHMYIYEAKLQLTKKQNWSFLRYALIFFHRPCERHLCNSSY